MHEQGLKPASIETKAKAIKAFLNFLYKEGYITEELSKRIPKPKTPHQYPYVLNDEQIDDLMKACDKATWEGFRNYVILLAFLDTGIRLSKLLSLTLKDVNLNKRSGVSPI